MHKHLGNTVTKTVDEIVSLLKVYQDHFINWIIISNETNQVIGIIRLGKRIVKDGKLTSSESQRLASAYWRKGYMKEARKLFYDYVFNKLNVDIQVADVLDGNINSIKSLESSGYRLTYTTKEIYNKTSKPTKRYIYSLSKDDYQKV